MVPNVVQVNAGQLMGHCNNYWHSICTIVSLSLVSISIDSLRLVLELKRVYKFMPWLVAPVPVITSKFRLYIHIIGILRIINIKRPGVAWWLATAISSPERSTRLV